MDIINEQVSMFTRITNAFAYFEKEGDNMSTSSCKIRMKSLEKTWEKFENNHMQLINHEDYEAVKAQPYVKDNLFLVYEQSYIKNMSKLQAYLDSQVESHNDSTHPPIRQFVTLDGERLPPLSIPHFNGDFTCWESFRDMFTSSVINKPNYSDIAKLHQLISVVEGDAKKLVTSYQPTEANFKIIWEKLKEKYEIKKRLVQAHISSIYSLKPISKSSATELKKILTGIRCTNVHLCLL